MGIGDRQRERIIIENEPADFEKIADLVSQGTRWKRFHGARSRYDGLSGIYRKPVFSARSRDEDVHQSLIEPVEQAGRPHRAQILGTGQKPSHHTR